MRANQKAMLVKTCDRGPYDCDIDDLVRLEKVMCGIVTARVGVGIYRTHASLWSVDLLTAIHLRLDGCQGEPLTPMAFELIHYVFLDEIRLSCTTRVLEWQHMAFLRRAHKSR